MFTVHENGTAILLCIFTMIGWGSWANTQKLAGRERWSFELYYWDYAIGVAVAGLVIALTLGSSGTAGMAAFPNLAIGRSILQALAAGALFNLANVLLVAAIDAAGMSVAFPVGIGLALVCGTALSYLQEPKGNVLYLICGVAAILVAMAVSALAYKRLPRQESGKERSGLAFALVAGLLMGFFYPQLIRSISPGFNSRPIAPAFLTPYSAILVFGFGVLLSTIPINSWFMRSRNAKFSDYLQARPQLHLPGILGGIIWMTALALNIVASGVAGPAISYALGQGATLIAALWGVFVWREFRNASPGTTPLLCLMLGAYSIGVVLIGLATQ